MARRSGGARDDAGETPERPEPGDDLSPALRRLYREVTREELPRDLAELLRKLE